MSELNENVEVTNTANENKRELTVENLEIEEVKTPIKKAKRELTEAQKGNLTKANAQRNMNQQYRKILDEQKSKTIVEIENIYKEKLDYFKKLKEYPVQVVEMAKPVVVVEEKKSNVTIETKTIEEPIKVEEKEKEKEVPKKKSNKKVVIKEPESEESDSEESEKSESEDSDKSESEESSSEEEIKYHSKNKKKSSKNQKNKKDKKAHKAVSNSKPLIFSYGGNNNHTFGGRRK